MNIGTAAVLIIVVAWVAFIIYRVVKKRGGCDCGGSCNESKNGSSGCGCSGCSGCSSISFDQSADKHN